MQIPTLQIEHSLSGIVCGIDEAGRGPWAGPVVAGAVILPKVFPEGINDSKKLSEKKREELFGWLTSNCVYGIGYASVEEIDEFNILKATKMAMARAYTELKIECTHALIDGNQLPQLPCSMQYVIKGDAVSLSIAAASIVAKVTRDRLMKQLHDEFPHYGWDNNKGYGAKIHSEAIEKYGITAYHRKSYAPIRAFLQKSA